MWRWSLLPLLLPALLLAPGAGADQAQEEACRRPLLEMAPLPPAFDPGTTRIIQFAVENPNGPGVDAVFATIQTTTPAGWSAVPAQRGVSLGPGEVRVNALHVSAPNRGTGEASGNVTLAVTFVCSAGDIQTSASTTRTLEVRTTAFRVPWALVLPAFLLLAAGVVMLGVRRLRRGVSLVAESPERTLLPGKSAKFTFLVENRRGKPVRGNLFATGLPEGWTAHLALDVLELEPGEEKAIWVILKAPPDAPMDTAVEMALRLEGEHGPRERAISLVRARIGST